MSLEISGTIKTVLPLEQGLTKAGAEWQKQSFIVANNDGYEGKEQIFCFEVFGEEKVQNFHKFNKVGDAVKVSLATFSEAVNPNHTLPSSSSVVQAFNLVSNLATSIFTSLSISSTKKRIGRAFSKTAVS